MATLIQSVTEWRELRRTLAGRSVGFVPTMGALHSGHGALLAQSRRENAVSVLSVFVNPTQFDDPSDLSAYPRTLDGDLELARAHGVDYVFAPNGSEMYPDQYRYRVTEGEISRELCGAHRPGHFDGVLTVVLKLLMLVRPDRAYFGEKDYQQLLLVQGMAEALFLETEIVACAIVRDADGLALSSRNARLSTSEREQAVAFPRALQAGGSPAAVRALLEEAGFGVDYIEDRGTRRLGAVRLGSVRLIDNVPL